MAKILNDKKTLIFVICICKKKDSRTKLIIFIIIAIEYTYLFNILIVRNKYIVEKFLIISRKYSKPTFCNCNWKFLYYARKYFESDIYYIDNTVIKYCHSLNIFIFREWNHYIMEILISLNFSKFNWIFYSEKSNSKYYKIIFISTSLLLVYLFSSSKLKTSAKYLAYFNHQMIYSFI